jgi:hypothetical protein
LFAAVSHKYIGLYIAHKLRPKPLPRDFPATPINSTNPEILLAEANRLAWLFNWNRAEPLYRQAEELFKERATPETKRMHG